MYLPSYIRSVSRCTSITKTWCLFAIMLVCGFARGQTDQVYFGSHTIHATQLCKEEKFDEAMAQIELAIRDSVDSSDFFTWYSRGFIYKEVYKRLESDIPESTYREIAVNSFLKSRRLAGNASEQTDNHDLALKYLANTYYNDALQATLQINQNNTHLGEGHIEKYCAIMQAINKAEECPAAFVDYYRAKGQRFHELWSADEKNKSLWDLARSNYSRALELAQHDCSISYNIVALYCNLLVTYRNNPELSTPDACNTMLREAESAMSITTHDCADEPSYAEMISQAQKLLVELKAEFNTSNSPSKN
jgi:tetratricopeptide (TPR) repeat protein